MAAPIHESITSLDGLTFESAPSEPTPATRVRESFSVDLGTIIGPAWGMFGGDGDMAGRYGGFWPADRVALPNHAPSPGIFSEIQYRAIVSWSRFLCERNMFAIGFRDRLRDFVGPVTVQFVRRGQNPGTQDADGNGVPDDPLIAQVQQFWDEWCESEDWGHGEEDRERECRERLCEDGEVTLRLGPTKLDGSSGGGLPWVRFIEPEQIRRPAWAVETDGDWEWGVCTDPDDAEGKPLALAVCDPNSGGGSGEEVLAGEFVRMKGNVKRSQKRGMPDFFPVEQALQVVLGLLSNLGTTGKAQSAIAWIQQYATATPDQVLSMIRQGADAYAQYGSMGGPQAGSILSSNGGPILPVKDNPAGTVIHADQNRQYAPGPVSTGVPSFMQIVDSTLKATGFRFGVPDWFTSGDGQSFAAALVTGSPFVRSIQDRQNKMIGFVKALAILVIELGEKSGRLPVGTSERVRPIATAQPVVIADDEKQARTFLALFEKNVADPIDFIKKRNGDPKVVAANIQSWAKKFAPAQPPAPGNPPPVAPGGMGKDPTPAPPGSAGGDGSSPNNPDDGGLGDVFSAVSEDFTHAGEMVAEGSAGLVQKKISVKGKGGKEYQRTVWVKPEQPKEVKPAKADPKALIAGVKQLLTDPSKITHDMLPGIAGKLKSLTVEQLKSLQAEHKAAGGKDKAARMAKLMDAVKAKIAAKTDSPHSRIRAAMDELGIQHDHLSDEQLAGHLGKAAPKAKAAAPAAELAGDAKSLASDLKSKIADVEKNSHAATDAEVNAFVARFEKLKLADKKALVAAVTGGKAKDGIDARLRIKSALIGVRQHLDGQDA